MNSIDRRRTTVLVAEDSADARQIFVDVLELHGYNVVSAVNGAEALRLVREGRVDVILTDMRMPMMDGLDLAMVVKNSRDLAHIPIVLLSATPLPDTWAVLNVFSASLVKPCPIEDLLAAIDRQVQAS